MLEGVHAKTPVLGLYSAVAGRLSAVIVVVSSESLSCTVIIVVKVLPTVTFISDEPLITGGRFSVEIIACLCLICALQVNSNDTNM